MERKTLEEKREARDYAVLVGLRSPVLGADSADEESLMELSEHTSNRPQHFVTIL